QVKSLGVVFDRQSFEMHVNNIMRSAYFHLLNISRIRLLHTTDSTAILVHALVGFRIDFCNSLMFGLPHKPLRKLQFVQNSAAHIITFIVHFSPVLYHLHWLPVKLRIEYKILLQSTLYISDLLHTYTPKHTLRSSSSIFLIVPHVTMEFRAFSRAAPHLWNSLPQSILDCDCLNTFRSWLKSHLSSVQIHF
ncbi:hypothetical protein C0J50_20557, partial [Silurus asotus]